MDSNCKQIIIVVNSYLTGYTACSLYIIIKVYKTVHSDVKCSSFEVLYVLLAGESTAMCHILSEQSNF